MIAPAPPGAQGTPNLVNYAGSVILAFTADGRLTQTLDNWIIKYTQDKNGLHAEGLLTANGVIQSQWSTDGAGNLLVNNAVREVVANAQMTITKNGQAVLSQPVNIPYGMGEGTSLYQCEGDTLLIDPYTPALNAAGNPGGLQGQYIVHNRVSP